MPRRDRAAHASEGAPLTSLKTGTHAVVLSLSSASAHERNKLMALGVMPGADIELLQRFPSYVVAVGFTQIALDKETAALIRVTMEG